MNETPAAVPARLVRRKEPNIIQKCNRAVWWTIKNVVLLPQTVYLYIFDREFERKHLDSTELVTALVAGYIFFPVFLPLAAVAFLEHNQDRIKSIIFGEYDE